MGLLSAFYFLCFLIFAVSVWSQTPSSGVNPLLTPQETEIRQKAKKRLYPGGRDEEPLKVQAQILAPIRKVNPASEAPPAEDLEPAETEHD